MAVWRMIGIKIRNESDLDKRLKKIGYELRLSHAELLDKWLTVEEAALREAGQLGLGLESASRGAEEAADVQAKVEKFEELIGRITALESEREALEPLERQLTDLTSQVQSLVSGLAVFQVQLSELERKAQPQPDEDTSQSAEPTGRKTELEVTEPAEVIAASTSDEQRWQKTKDYIRVLWDDGNGPTKNAIAERLTAEGILTKSGSARWYGNMITRALEEI